MKPSSKMTPDARQRALAAVRASHAAMTPSEDAAITAAAEADPDNPPLGDEFFERATPRRGRPASSNPKQHVNVRLDADVVEALKADGQGWQTRLNAILRDALKLNSAA